MNLLTYSEEHIQTHADVLFRYRSVVIKLVGVRGQGGLETVHIPKAAG